VKILFASTSEPAGRWIPALQAALPDDRFVLEPAPDVEVALVAQPPPRTFERLPHLKFIQSLWMGVDQLLANPALPRRVPIARLLDPGMIAAMTETVLAHVLDWHRLHFRYREQQAQRLWKPLPQVLAGERTIGLLGIGELGTAVGRALCARGFRVLGWSRRGKQVDGIECITDRNEVLARSDLLVCMLPLTPQTRRILNAQAFSQMPEGACLINVARGAHVVERDLVVALDSGWLTHAYLDVFENEPLDPESPLWGNPRVTITPHVAALTEPRTALPKVVENIERVRRGEAPEGLVDRVAGY
jgi:glyoxylate/hydroxypyruvate reductase A